MSDRLFTPRFFLMCGFSFTVFLSAFQLLPTAPFHILALGGDEFAAGLFLALLTYASSVSAPLTGALSDRFGKRRMLLVGSLASAAFSLACGLAPSYPLLLVLVAIYGVFWSGMLSSSAAYTTDIIPAHRRAEGIGYWGLSTVVAIAIAPTIGLWIYQRGWLWVCLTTTALNIVMGMIAWQLPETDRAGRAGRADRAPILEWRLFAVALTLFLYSFGYGGITSFVALYATANHVTPVGIYFTVFSLMTVLTRPLSGPLADRRGHRRVFIPCLALVVVGYALLAVAGTRAWLVASAIVFGIGFGSAYPVFIAHVMQHVDDRRRGSAFGSIIAAFDVGIGTGSMTLGWVIQHYGFGRAYAVAAIVASLSIPYFLMFEKRLLHAHGARQA